jgi:hypothetical protein
MTILSSRGRVSFSISRASGFGVGVYRITFNAPAPDANYVISAIQEKTGNVKVWDTTRQTADTFHPVSYSQTWSLVDTWFHLTVYV